MRVWVARHGSGNIIVDAQGLLAEVDAHGLAPAPCSRADFIASGLRAARHAAADTRRRILRDVAAVLGCEAGDLDFMFIAPSVAANDADPVTMPDYGAGRATYASGALLVAE